MDNKVENCIYKNLFSLYKRERKPSNLIKNVVPRLRRRMKLSITQINEYWSKQDTTVLQSLPNTRAILPFFSS